MNDKNFIYALSVKEPWLSMIVDGKKTIETRTWAAPIYLDGVDLLLVGSKNPKGRFAGKAACSVNVYDCQPMQKKDEEAACCEIYPNAKSWVLKNVRKVKPVEISGRLGIYKIDAKIIELISVDVDEAGR